GRDRAARGLADAAAGLGEHVVEILPLKSLDDRQASDLEGMLEPGLDIVARRRRRASGDAGSGDLVGRSARSISTPP
ncbi:MAG: hypothetical protein HC850_16420, partial [Rhodomicrobium sp.]|nr:hypothetical protein [Rhodomicrobium sp.]